MAVNREKLEQYMSYALADPVRFALINAGIELRSYQVDVIRTITDSVLNNKGFTFAVMFPRQSGKNELQAQLEAYLLTLLSSTDAEIVKISPTWRPQSLNAMHRLERILKNGKITRYLWKRNNGYIFNIGRARISFLSGEPQAHIVGATASTLLEVDEAQDVTIAKYDKEIAPMAASTNATRVFWGTAWTSQTLLAREIRASQDQQSRDDQPRVFILTAADVAQEVHGYGNFVRDQIDRLGRNHPLVRTQFFSEEIEADAGMFPLTRQVSMQGDHPAQTNPIAGRIYAFLIDVGGDDALSNDGSTLNIKDRDSTALTIVEIQPQTPISNQGSGPIYRVVYRQVWTGVSQPVLYDRIRDLYQHWRPRRVLVDATGIGAGLAGFLQKSIPGKVIPFIFTTASKSSLGWDFLTICDTGRFLDYLQNPSDTLQKLFWQQLTFCQMLTNAGPGRTLHWGVPDGTRDPQTGERIHDDLIISAALCARLETFRWVSSSGGSLIPGKDPLIDSRRQRY